MRSGTTSMQSIPIKDKRRARMFTKFTLTLITILLLASLAGCGNTNPSNNSSMVDNSGKSQTTPAATTDEDNYQMLPVISNKVANLKLDASADGTTQKLKVGEVLSISLESNASTGYTWVANSSDTTILVSMGEPEYSDPTQSGTPLVGAPGTQTFYFQAAAGGTATVTLNYQRPWEANVAPAQTIVITVEVQ